MGSRSAAEGSAHQIAWLVRGGGRRRRRALHRVCDRARGHTSFGAAGSDDDGAVAEDELGAMVSDTETLFESERAAEPITYLGHVVVRQHGDDGGPGH